MNSNYEAPLSPEPPKLAIRRAEDRGRPNFGWLDSRHTVSFGHYHDPRFMGFGSLRVINEDRVQPGRGFDTHGHQDMEIISYVLEGSLEHKDSMGTGSVIRPGDGAAIADTARITITGTSDAEALLFDLA